VVGVGVVGVGVREMERRRQKENEFYQVHTTTRERRARTITSQLPWSNGGDVKVRRVRQSVERLWVRHLKVRDKAFESLDEH